MFKSLLTKKPTVSTKANKLINGETVNYSLAYAVSFFILLALKQLLHTFCGVGTTISVAVGFVVAEVALFFLEKYFVFKDRGINGNVKQVLFTVVNVIIHFGVYETCKILIVSVIGWHDFLAWFASAIIIFVVNYFIARYIAFDIIEKAELKKGGRVYALFYEYRYVALSVAVATVCILFIYLVFRAFPWGDTTVLRMDLYHQYGPLFVELFDRVVDHETFLYSMTSGGGSSFLGNYFNYLSSPLTTLIFLFDREEMAYAITLLVAVKCVLSAGSMSFYLKKSQKGTGVATSAFGVLYAFSAYFLAYFWNIMWLDAMYLLPIILLGIETMINTGHKKLYFISLFIMFYSSYYMAYMICIFSCVYFIAYFFLNNNPNTKVNAGLKIQKKFSLKKIANNKFINRGVTFAVTSIMVAAVSAVFLLLVYFILSGASATSDSFPTNLRSYFTMFDLLESHFANLTTTIRSSGDDILPNIYCGILPIILVPLYLINKEIGVREKVVYVALLAFLIISFDTNYTDFIWHAFHFPNDLPYRYSYMYSFLFVVVAFKSFKHIKALSIKEIGIVTLGWAAIVAVSSEFTNEKVDESAIYVTLILLAVWCGFLFLYLKNYGGKIVMGTLIMSMVFCEVVVSDSGPISLVQRQSSYVAEYDTYTEDIAYIEENDADLYRLELTDLKTRMDPCLYGYSGISIFSSMAYEDLSQLQYSLGMYGNRVNSYTYNLQTPVYNMMFNLKYLIYNGEGTRPTTALYTKCYESEDEETVIYENDYYLPIAYCVNEAVNSWDTSEDNPFRVQGDFFSLATGYSDVFKEVSYLTCDYYGVTVDNVTENGYYWYSATSDYGTVDITIQPNTDGNVYLYIATSDVASVYCTCDNDGVSQSLETPYILDLGYHTVDETITISLDCSDTEEGVEGSFEIFCYSLDMDVLNAGYTELQSGTLEVESYTETNIVGTVTATENCVLYSSIPYDEGWTVYVDGEEVETFEIGNSLLGIMLKPGEHTVEYSYTPKGLLVGAVISGVAVVALVGYEVFKYRRRKKELVMLDDGQNVTIS